MGKNIIEINGKRYDAVTGAMLGNASTHRTATSDVRVLDGFKTHHSKPAARVAGSHAVHNQSRKPQRASTLVRAAVKKPAPTRSNRISGLAGNTTRQAVDLSPELRLASRIEPERAARASHTHKSNLVHKFDVFFGATSSVIKKTIPLAVKAHPEPEQGAAHAAVSKSTDASNRSNIDEAVAVAHSHEQPAVPKKRLHHRVAHRLHVSPRAVSMSSAALVILVLGGFFAYQNVPNLAMRVAATRAGFGATMPNYRPAGFSLNGPIKYSPGTVTVSFKSNTDTRAFTVSQKSSNWNSDTLLTNVVIASNKPYQTFEDKGRTIYIYDDANATWVNGGVWYKIEGNSKLTSDQLVRIASSM